MYNCRMFSIDSSTSSTGIGVFLNGKFDKTYLFDFKDIKNTDERMNKMCISIMHLIEQEMPDIVVTELTVVTRNAQAQRNLSMLLGAIWGTCLKLGIFYYSFRPTEWRSLIDSEKKPRKREELKLWSMNKVKELYDIEPTNDDESDAVLVGTAYIKKFT